MALRSLRSSTVAVLVTGMSCALVGAQKDRTVPRALDGHPDLQGLWVNNTATPLERPRRFAEKEYLTEAEAAAYEKDYESRFRDLLGDLEAQTTGEIDDIWNESGPVVPSRRTSLIVDPPDGKVPPLTLEGRRRADARVEARKQHPADGPEDLTLWSRCLLSIFGTPMRPISMNPNLQIVQTRDYLMILGEAIHEARIIPLDGRPHLPSRIRRWTGDSRGRWEGDSLVIDTTNFTDQPTISGSDAQLHVVERLTRESMDLIRYDFTIDDATIFTRSWTASLPLRRGSGPIYEYACHEANYSLVNVLRGARAAEHEQKEP